MTTFQMFRRGRLDPYHATNVAVFTTLAVLIVTLAVTLPLEERGFPHFPIGHAIGAL